MIGVLKNFIHDLQAALERLDRFRDKVLFVFIKPFWPRKITPNHLTIFRIGIGLFLFILLFYYKNDGFNLIISLFFIGIVTDLLDGSIARALNEETRVGAMMDPVADRILIVPIAIYSLSADHRWLLLLLILLEILNALISIWAHGKSIFIESNIFGKIKMFLHSIVFLAILVFWPRAPHIFFIYLLWISSIVMVVSIYVKTLDFKKLQKICPGA